MFGLGDGYVRVKGILVCKIGNVVLIDFDLENDFLDKIYWIFFLFVYGGDEFLFFNENSIEVV